MQWIPVLFLLGTLLLIVGTATQENSNGSSVTDGSSQSPDHNIRQVNVATTNVGGFKYQDGEVILLQNQRKASNFFFTPFPHVEPNLTDCNYNDFSGRTELTLFVSLYTAALVESVEDHIKKHQNICGTEHCEVSLLPMHYIRLFQAGFPPTIESQRKYRLDTRWHSNTQLLQTVEFIIETSNMSICERLKDSITSRCRLSNFEIHYSLHGQQTTARTLEVTTEHVTKTSIFNRIKSQFSSYQQDTVALTRDDFKNLLNEIMEQITMNLRIEEGFEGIQDTTGIDQMLKHQLQYKQVQLTSVNDRLWDSLYWTPELTRPDRLSKVLNKVLKQDATDIDKFRYDYSQADEALNQKLNRDESQKLDNFQKNVVVTSQYTNAKVNINMNFSYKANFEIPIIASGTVEAKAKVNIYNETTYNNDVIHYKNEMDRSNSTNIERQNGSTIILERKDAEKLIRYLSEHAEIEGDTIKPKSIDVTLVKFGSLKSSTKLFSNTVYVKTRTNVHILPVRCPYEYRQQSLANGWFTEKNHRSSNDFDALTKKLTTDLQVINSSTSLAESRLDQKMVDIVDKFKVLIDAVESRLNQTTVANVGKSKMLINAAESRLNQIMVNTLRKSKVSINASESRLNRTVVETVDKFKVLIDATESRLNQTMVANVDKSKMLINATESRHDQKMVAVESRLIKKIEEIINATKNQTVNRFHALPKGIYFRSNVLF